MEKLYSLIWSNELIFSITVTFWMLSTAAGGLAGRKEFKADGVFLILITVAPFLIFLPDIIKFQRENFIHVFSLSEIILIALAVTAPAGFLTGLGFVTLSRNLKPVKEYATSIAYLSESAGSFTGALTTFLLFQVGVSEESSMLISGLLVATTLIILQRKGKFFPIWIIYLILLIATPSITRFMWEKTTEGRVIASRRGKFSPLTLIEKSNSFTLYGGYFPLYTFPDPSKKRMILTPQFVAGKEGGNLLIYSYDAPNFTLSHYKPALIRPDPGLKFVEKPSKLPVYSRIIYYGDILDYLRKEKERFGSIEISLNHIPSTIRDERFFSPQFLQVVRNSLNRDGLLIFQLEETKNYPDDAEKLALSLMRGEGERFFRFSYIFPFENIYLVFTDHPLPVKNFCQRRADKFKNSSEFYYVMGMCNQSLIDFYNSLKPAHVKIQPYIYLMGIAHWENELTGGRTLFLLLKNPFTVKVLSLIILIFILTAMFMGKKNSSSYFILTGFTGLFSEITVLYTFQYKFGVIYHHIALLMGVFMISLSAGTYLSLKISSKKFVPLLTAISGVLTLIFSTSILPVYIGVILLFSSFGIIFSEGALSKYSSTSNVGETSSFAEFTDHISGAAGAISSPLILSTTGLTGGLIIVILLVVILEMIRKG